MLKPRGQNDVEAKFLGSIGSFTWGRLSSASIIFFLGVERHYLTFMKQVSK